MAYILKPNFHIAFVVFVLFIILKGLGDPFEEAKKKLTFVPRDLDVLDVFDVSEIR